MEKNNQEQSQIKKLPTKRAIKIESLGMKERTQIEGFINAIEAA